MTIICACVPSLKPVAARFSPSIISNRHEIHYFRSGGSGMIDVLTRNDHADTPRVGFASHMVSAVSVLWLHEY
jgi:hypothetical protein